MSVAETHIFRGELFPREPEETCTRDGAVSIAKKIEAFWAERGKVVNIRIVNCGFHPTTRGARWEIKSDMVDGLPTPGAERIALFPIEVGKDREQ